MILQDLYNFVTKKTEQEIPQLLKKYFDFIVNNIQNSELRLILSLNTKKKNNAMNREKCDYLFRFCEYETVKKLLQIVYLFDAFQAVAANTEELNLVFPKITNCKTVEIIGLYHLFVKDAVANDVFLNENKNIFFLTGANMAGKSTFFKAFGVAVYLAHLGFPVAATSMKIGVFNGLFSTINITDSLNNGYSHFYAEVLRVKKVAEEIKQTENLIVIFDELFRGTNVKDAFDASLAIISAFASIKGSVFLISTHIMEVAEQLKNLENINFGYFKTIIDGKKPIYNYRLQNGVTNERLGMLIIENEKIIEIIKSEKH